MKRLAPALLGLALGVAAASAETTFKPYGYFKLDLARDSAGSSPGNYSLYVRPHATGAGQALLSLTARQTRLGVHIARDQIKGRIEADFYGASPENKNALMLRHAYVDIPLGALHVRAGQGPDIIAPLVPATLDYGVLYGSGNLGYRRPQVTLVGRAGPYSLSLGLGRNLSADLDGDTVVDGDAGTPTLQCRFALDSAGPEGRLQTGVSAHYGRCSCPDDDRDYANWSVGGDLRLKLGQRLSLEGEAFWGQNLRQFGGAIYNTDTLDGLRSRGGWGSLRFQASPVWRFGAGAGFESLEAADLEGVSDARAYNSAYFANGLYTPAEGVDFGLEISRRSTRYRNRSAGTAAAPTAWRLHWIVQTAF